MTIEYGLEHPAERVYALLTDKTFLAERIEAVGEDPPTIKISDDRLAGELVHHDGDGWSGSYLIEFDGVPGHVAADFDLYPTDDGCVYSITHKPRVTVPVIGKTLEKILASQVEDGCDAEIDYLVEALG